MKKYELTDETIEVFGYVLHRVCAIRDFGTVKTGDLGGYVEGEKNLSHEENCWVYGDAKVYGDAWVSGNAKVKANQDIFWISCIGSRCGTTTFYRCSNENICVTCGCFYGNLQEFSQKVETTHGESKHGIIYKLAIEMAKEYFREDGET